MNEEETAMVQTELEGLRAQAGERDARLGELQAQLAEALAANDAGQQELTSMKAALDERDAELAAATETLHEAVASYRAALVAANPQIPEEMVAGATIADIDASLDRARDMAGRVRQTLEEDLKATHVPAGAPERAVPDLSAMSPREKIHYALGKEA